MLKLLKNLSVVSSIRSKLIALLLFLVGLPLLISGYLSYQSASEALLKQTTQQFGNLVEKTSQQIDNFFQSAKKDIDLLSDFPFVQLAFLQFEFRQSLDTVQRLLLDYSKKNDHFSHIYIIALDGRPILAVPSLNLDNHNFKQTHWFKQTLQHGLYLSDIMATGNTSDKGVILGKLIYDFENPSHPVGVLAFHIKHSAYSIFAKSLQIGSGGHGLLMHHDGNIIQHSNRSFVSVQDIAVNGDERLKRLIQKMTAGENGYGHYSFFGEERFLVFTTCRERPWSVAITVLKAELMADIIRFQKKILTFFACILLLIIPASYIFIRGITRPINQLIDGASRIGSGDLDQTIRIESNDELQAVAKEFNKMAARLKISMDEIINLKNFNEDILRNITSGIITVDRGGRITSINICATRILGYQIMPPGNASAANAPGHVQEILNELETTLSNSQNVRHKQLTINRADQETFYVEVDTSLLSSKSGKVFGAIAEIRDITARKRMEEMMIRVEKLASLGELSAGMAHEIRNPLAGIKTSVQVLAKRVIRPEVKELLSGIGSEINRLNKIVSDLLRFSRPSPPLTEPLDIDLVLEKTLELISEKIRTHAIVVDKRIDHHNLHASADREQIQQVFLNLILNSIKAMKNGGRLTIDILPAAEQANRWVRNRDLDNLQLSRFLKIVFADTGHGISPDHLQKIFNPFFTTDPKGTGLGLSITHKLVAENGGHIFIDSTKGQGTRAILLLPVACEE